MGFDQPHVLVQMMGQQQRTGFRGGDLTALALHDVESALIQRQRERRLLSVQVSKGVEVRGHIYCARSEVFVDRQGTTVVILSRRKVAALLRRDSRDSIDCSPPGAR